MKPKLSRVADLRLLRRLWRRILVAKRNRQVRLDFLLIHTYMVIGFRKGASGVEDVPEREELRQRRISRLTSSPGSKSELAEDKD